MINFEFFAEESQYKSLIQDSVELLNDQFLQDEKIHKNSD